MAAKNPADHSRSKAMAALAKASLWVRSLEGRESMIQS
jgi:hypothetical protein